MNKNFEMGNVMIAGTPAKIIKEAEAWYLRDGAFYSSKVEKIERLRQSLHL